MWTMHASWYRLIQVAATVTVEIVLFKTTLDALPPSNGPHVGGPHVGCIHVHKTMATHVDMFLNNRPECIHHV